MASPLPRPDGAPAPRQTALRLLPLAAIALGLAAVFAFDLDRYLSFEALSERRETLLAWRDRHFALALAAFVAAYVAMTALSVPGAVWMTVGGGFLFGAPLATALVVLGATAGATLIFLAARYALADWLRAKAGPAIRRMEAGFSRNALSYMLVLRLVPLFPFWLVNLVPAFLGVRLRDFVLGTLLGIVPGTFVFAAVGSGLGAVFDAGAEPDLAILFEPAILLPIVGLAVLALIPVGYRRWRAGRCDGGPAGGDAP